MRLQVIRTIDKELKKISHERLGTAYLYHFINVYHFVSRIDLILMSYLSQMLYVVSIQASAARSPTKYATRLIATGKLIGTSN